MAICWAVSSGRSVIPPGASDGVAAVGERSDEGLLRLIERVVVQPKHLQVTLRKDDVSISLRPSVAAEDDDLAHEVTYVVRIPFSVERNRGSVLVVTPSNAAATHPAPNPALVKSVVRGNEWARKLLVGEVRSLGELAKEAGVTTAYVSRLVRYAFLAPEISESIFSGTPSLDLAPLGLTGELPLDWSRQRALVGL